jgi:syntaxin 5
MAENRTTEFLALARSLPEASMPPKAPESASASSTNASGRYNHKETSFVQLKDFHTTAGGISRDIAGASAMLGELTKLVRQKSLFQDDTQDINDLVFRIKSSIENLNGRLDDAGRQIAHQKKTFGKNSQVGQQTSNLVEQLKEEFGQAAGGFKDILQQRTDVMKETIDRKRQIYGADDDIPVLNLENKPPVYGEESSSIGAMGFPTLDLTSGMATGEPTGSGSQLPRPREYLVFYFYLKIIYFDSFPHSGFLSSGKTAKAWWTMVCDFGKVHPSLLEVALRLIMVNKTQHHSRLGIFNVWNMNLGKIK